MSHRFPAILIAAVVLVTACKTSTAPGEPILVSPPTNSSAQPGTGVRPKSGWWEIAPQDPNATMLNGAETALSARRKYLEFRDDGSIRSLDSLTSSSAPGPGAAFGIYWGAGGTAFGDGSNAYSFDVVSPTYLKGFGTMPRLWSLPMQARWITDSQAASDAPAAPWPSPTPIPNEACIWTYTGSDSKPLTVSVIGQVVDEAGAPVAGATVTGTLTTGRWWPGCTPTLTATTGSDGRFTLPDSIRADNVSVSAGKTGYQDATITSPLPTFSSPQVSWPGSSTPRPQPVSVTLTLKR